MGTFFAMASQDEVDRAARLFDREYVMGYHVEEGVVMWYQAKGVKRGLMDADLVKPGQQSAEAMIRGGKALGRFKCAERAETTYGVAKVHPTRFKLKTSIDIRRLRRRRAPAQQLGTALVALHRCKMCGGESPISDWISNRCPKCHKLWPGPEKAH